MTPTAVAGCRAFAYILKSKCCVECREKRTSKGREMRTKKKKCVGGKTVFVLLWLLSTLVIVRLISDQYYLKFRPRDATHHAEHAKSAQLLLAFWPFRPSRHSDPWNPGYITLEQALFASTLYRIGLFWRQFTVLSSSTKPLQLGRPGPQINKNTGHRSTECPRLFPSRSICFVW